jgi:hypothetical protein
MKTKDNYVKSINEYFAPKEMFNDESGMDRSSLRLSIEVVEGQDGRVVILEQDGQIIQIQEDMVDHYMSEIMGQLDQYNSSERESENNWEDELPKF